MTSASKLEFIKCALCGADNPKTLFVSHDRMLKGKENFQAVQCQNCELIYLNPRPSSHVMSQYYPENYSPFLKDKNKIIQKIRETLLDLEVRNFKKTIPPGGRILEIGCARGDFLNAAQKTNLWKIQGIEMNPSAAAWGRKHFGLKIITGTLRKKPFPNQHFDVVIMRHVLEHLPDPAETLIEIKRILKPPSFKASCNSVNTSG